MAKKPGKKPELENELKRLEQEREQILKEKAELEARLRSDEKEKELKETLEAEKARLEVEKEELTRLQERVGKQATARQQREAPEAQPEPRAAKPKAAAIELSQPRAEAKISGEGKAHKFAIVKRYYGIGEFAAKREEGGGVVSKTRKLIRFGE